MGGSMMGTADPDIQVFIDRFGRFFEETGASRSGGQILAWLLISEEPQSLDDIAAGLHISKASASLGTRQWEQSGLIERVHKRGDRKVYYRLPSNIAHSLTQASLQKFHQLVELAELGRDAIGADRPSARAVLDQFVRVYRHLNERVPEILAELEEE